MRLCERSKTLALLALLTLGLTGCSKTEHVLQTSGQTGVSLGGDRAMFPDGKGNLTPGKFKMVPGALIRLPKTQQEVIDALKGAGVNINEPGK